MVATLDNVNEKLQSLADLIEPVIETINESDLLLNNVQSSISIVDSVLRYYEIRDELASTIMSGPGGNLTDYLVNLDGIQEAVKYFKRVTAIYERERVTKLYDIGRQKLVEESDKLILRYANPWSPKELLELCRSTSSAAGNQMIDIHSMQVADMNSLRIVFDWFERHGFRKGLIDSYTTKRGTMIRRSLQLLAEHLRQTSVRRASISRFNDSPRLPVRRPSYNSDTLRVQVKTKINEIGRHFTRLPASGGRRPSLKSSSLLSPGTGTLNGLLDVDMLSPSVAFSDDRETNNYQLILDAFVFLLLHDCHLLAYVFSNEYKPLVFNKLIELPLAYMHEEAQFLCETISQLPDKLYTGRLVVYGLCSIVRWFLKARPHFSKLYQEINLETQQQFHIALSTRFEHSAVECLRLILDEVRSDSSEPSQDGNVHPLTSHVLAFMEGLLAYEETFTAVTSICVDEKQRVSGASSSPVDKRLFDLSSYFADLVQGLRTSILEKADMHMPHHDSTLRALFLLNNTNYLLERLESSSLLTSIERFEKDLQSQLKSDVQQSMKEYTKCYTPLIIAMQQMLEYDNSNRLPDTKLRERDRNQLKESFLTVNAAIDTLRRRCETYIVMDLQLRDHLRNESKKLIMDMFKIYHSKFARKDFTQKPGKYLRYNPSMLESILENFFEH